MFIKRLLKICETFQLILMFALVIGPGVVVGARPKLEGASFFERHLFGPIIVALVILGIGVINFAAMLRPTQHISESRSMRGTPNKITPLEPPPVVSGSVASLHLARASLPVPAFSGGR